MKFFLNTANLDLIKKARELELLDGVITNPKSMLAEGVSNKEKLIAHCKSICKIATGCDICVDVFSTDFDRMVRQAKFLSAISGQIVLNIPITSDGIRAIRFLNAEGIKTNCTFVATLGQALLAGKAGATYVSPMNNSYDDSSSSRLTYVEELRNIFEKSHYHTQIIVSEVKDPQHIVEFAKIGADAVETSLDNIYELMKHSQSSYELDKLLNDIKIYEA
jgi:transaldolase